MTSIMIFIAKLLTLVLDIYMWIIIAGVAVSWLIAFDVLNDRHPQARNLIRLLDRATEPAYRHLRKYIPPIGGIDLTPLIIIIGLTLMKSVVWWLFVPDGISSIRML